MDDTNIEIMTTNNYSKTKKAKTITLTLTKTISNTKVKKIMIGSILIKSLI